MFITFEGPDGSGKTTVLKGLLKYLDKNRKDIDYIFTREPGGSNMIEAKKIRDIILDNKHHIPEMAEAILYAADRRLNLEKNIWPALKKGKVVLCDRYLDSSLAYQGNARGLGIEKIKALQDVITENTYPDLTIFFDIKPKIAQKRVSKRAPKDRIEATISAQKVYDGYLKIMKLYPERKFKIIDASKSKQEVLQAVIKSIEKELGIKKKK